jgi:hypothetical protein
MFAWLDVHELSSAASGKQSTKVSGSETRRNGVAEIAPEFAQPGRPILWQEACVPCSALNQKREAP